MLGSADLLPLGYTASPVRLIDHSGSHTAGWLVAIVTVLSLLGTLVFNGSNWVMLSVLLNVVTVYGLLRAAVWARILTALCSIGLILFALLAAYRIPDSGFRALFAVVGFVGLSFLLLVIGQPGRLRWWTAIACLTLPAIIVVSALTLRDLRKPGAPAVASAAAKEEPVVVVAAAAVEPEAETEIKPSRRPDVERPMQVGWLIGKWANAANPKEAIVFDETGGCTMGTVHGTYRALSKTIVADMKDKEHLPVSLTFSPSEDRNYLMVVGSVSGSTYVRSH